MEVKPFTRAMRSRPLNLLMFERCWPFLVGGISGAAATAAIQPIDTLKVQIQIISEQLGRNCSKALSILNILSKIH
jgi:hypothetical protein